MKRVRAFVCALAMGVVAAGAPAFAQTASGTLSGQVVDDTGGVLPGATGTRRCEDAGRQRVAVTDNMGRSAIAGLTQGRYVLTVSLGGFETLTREEVDTSNGAVPLRLVLKVSGLQDSIVVRGTARNVASS